MGQRGPDRRNQFLVTRDGGDVEQANPGSQIIRTHAAALRQRPNAVIEAYLGVPDGVPQAVSEGDELTVAQTASVVQQHEVEIGQRTRLAAPERAHRRKRHSGYGAPAGRVGPDLAQPGRGVVGDGRSTHRAGTRVREGPGAGEVETSAADIG